MTVLRSVAYGRGVTIPASPLGKVKMMSEVIAILLLILGREFLQQFFVLGQIALWVVLVTALISAVDYYRRFTRIGSKAGSAIEELTEPDCQPRQEMDDTAVPSPGEIISRS